MTTRRTIKRRYNHAPDKKDVPFNKKVFFMASVVSVGLLYLVLTRSNNKHHHMNSKRNMIKLKHDKKSNVSSSQGIYGDTTSKSSVRKTYHSWGPEGADIHELLRLFNLSYHDAMNQTNPFQADQLRNVYVVYQPFPVVVTVTEDNTPRLMVPQRSYEQVKQRNGRRLDAVNPYFQRALAVQLPLHQAEFAALTNAGTIVDAWIRNQQFRQAIT